jgi:type III secretion protein J
MMRAWSLVPHFLHCPAVRLAAPLVFFLLTGCVDDVLHGLREEQATEAVEALHARGVPASTRRNKDGTFAVLVDGGRHAEANRMLQDLGLPRRPCKPAGGTPPATGGLVPSPEAERMRQANFAAQELACTIGLIDGVREARVHLALPERNPTGGSREQRPGSASVLVRHDPCVALQAHVPGIKSLVAAGLPGLGSDPRTAYDRVEVVLAAAQGACAARFASGGSR